MVEKTEAIQKILTYLGNRPEKEDTLEGITNWWIKSDKGSHWVEEVLYALQLLIGQHEVEEVKVRKDVVVYRVRKRQNI